MKVSFLFLDDCHSSDTNISSLTGLLIPVDTYSSLRSEFYAMMLNTVYQGKKFIDPDLPELKASNLLRIYEGANDELRFHVFEEAVRLVACHHVDIFRVGHYLTGEIRCAIR